MHNKLCNLQYVHLSENFTIYRLHQVSDNQELGIDIAVSIFFLDFVLCYCFDYVKKLNWKDTCLWDYPLYNTFSHFLNA